MSRSEDERFADILGAIERCLEYAPHLHSDELGSMAYDAVLRNLAVVGEAVRTDARAQRLCERIERIGAEGVDRPGHRNT